MKAELEVKFVDIDIDDVRERLRAAGADLAQPMRLMRRVLVEEPHHAAENAFLRVRDEGNKVTLTFKRRDKSKKGQIDSTKEIEVEVSDFDRTVELFAEAGWHYRTYQETRREGWVIDGTEVVIDEWPWMPPQIEIEGQTGESVKAVAAKLGFDWADAEYGNIDTVYQRFYSFANGFRGIIDLPEVRFDDPVPAVFTPR